MKQRTKAQDHSNVSNLHKPGAKPGPGAAFVKPPLTRGPMTPVSPTQPDTRVK